MLLAVLVLVAVVLAIVVRARRARLVDQIPGPPALPIIGNTLQLSVERDDVFDRVTGTTLLWGHSRGIARAWLGTSPYVLLSRPHVIEPILSSNKHIDKSKDYVYLRPWLGTGLLTSGGSKWHARRKVLTPAFHFKILEDFIDVFREQSDVLVQRLQQEVGQEAFNIFPYVTLCTLDIICESAMGRQVNAQKNSDSEYVRAVYEMGFIVQRRQANLWLQPDWIFRFTSLYQRHKKCIEILHGFSNKVIQERRQEMLEKQHVADKHLKGCRRRLAFLDLLLAYSQDGDGLSQDDIREEVDTFMFEGHDTTSAAISWTLFLLGSHPDVQGKVVQELDDIFYNTDRPFTMKDLHDMRYLDCCIKEALRLYPSVPLVARQLNEDVILGNYKVPAGTTALIVIYMLHRCSDTFPDPERFMPERFLPEQWKARHPYAFIPFSAGPRNCIGQKFAMLELKAVLSTVLRRFHIEAVDRREDLTLLSELILRPKDGLRVRISPRQE